VRSIISGIIVTFLLVCMFALAFKVRPAEASVTIYIRADGLVDPSTAPIHRDGYEYVFTDNVNDPIVIERDNIVINGAGHTDQGTGASGSIGINLYGRTNVTVQNMSVENFYYGIRLLLSSNNTISENNIAVNTWAGVSLESSSNYNTISSNNIVNNAYYGIWFDYCSGSTISRNSITMSGVYGIVIHHSSNYNVISDNSITNNEHGLLLHSYSNYNTISGNRITSNNLYGVRLDRSSNNTFSGNTMTNNWDGLELYSSGNNSISGNVFNGDGLTYLGPAPGHNNGGYMGSGMSSMKNTVVDNTVNGKSIVYLQDAYNQTVVEAGQVIIVRSEYIRVENLNLTHTTYGIQLLSSRNALIADNNIVNNLQGIWLENSCANTISRNKITTNNQGGIEFYYSSNNTISDNEITNDEYGIELDYSLNNTISDNIIARNNGGVLLDYSSSSKIFHNNFINQYQVYSYQSTNVWDDGYPSGGNRWSDYTGVDSNSGPYQNVTGSDGIGDTSYVIDANNQDHYPLMKTYGGPYDIGITNITESETAVMQGLSLNLSIKVSNYGIGSETFNVTVYANTNIIATITGITLTSRNSTTITLTWQTSIFDLGKYTMSAYASAVPGETYTADNFYVDGTVQIYVAHGGPGRQALMT
jgi:parallel beta-helix repeat protein